MQQFRDQQGLPTPLSASVQLQKGGRAEVREKREIVHHWHDRHHVHLHFTARCPSHGPTTKEAGKSGQPMYSGRVELWSNNFATQLASTYQTASLSRIPMLLIHTIATLSLYWQVFQWIFSPAIILAVAVIVLSARQTCNSGWRRHWFNSTKKRLPLSCYNLLNALCHLTASTKTIYFPVLHDSLSPVF